MVQSKAPRVPQLPGYDVKGLIGKGANGVVFRATQLSMQRDVAVKFLNPRLSKNPAFIDAFLKEARSAARLSHPNIILGIDVGEHEGLYYFVMEYVDGRMLRQLLKERGRLPEPEALRIAAQIAAALDHAHRAGLVHRDIKPANIMITDDGTAKLCDLGIAVDVKDEEGKPRALVGTPYYLSPEQARVEPDIDIRADIYSLGATLYHMLVGEPPFKGDGPEAVIARHLSDPPEPPRQRRPDITRRTNDLLLQMLEKERAKRPQSPNKLADELYRCAEYAGRQAVPAGRKPIGERLVRRRNYVPLVVCLLLIVAGGAAAWWFRDAFASKPPPADTNAASDEYESLRKRVEADEAFEDVDEIVAAFEAYRKKHGGAWAVKSDLLRVEYLRGLDLTLRPTYEDLRRRDEALAAQGRLTEAIRVYDAFPHRAVAPTGAEIEARVAELRAAIDARLKTDRAEVDRLMKVGEYEGALARLAVVDDYAPDMGWVKERRARIAERRNSAEDQARLELERAFAPVDADFRRLMAERKFAAARAAMLAFHDARGPVEGFDRAGIESLPVAEIVARCEVVAGDENPNALQACILSIRNAADVERLVGDSELPIAELEKRFPDDRALGFAYFYSGEPGAFERAQELLERSDVPGANHYALNLALAREQRLRGEIAAQWETAQRCVRESRWTEAAAAVEAIRDAAPHPDAMALEPPLKTMMETVGPKLEVVRALELELKGRVVSLDDGRITVRYDFATRDQFSAFENVLGEWTWEEGRLRSDARRSAIAWRRPFEGDATVSFDLTARECRNIVTTLYYNAGGDRHYSFTLGLDVVTGTADPTDVVEGRQGLPRHTIVKYPAKVPDSAEDPTFWKAWRAAMVGGPKERAGVPLDEPVRVSVERDGAALRLRIGGTLVWEGSDADYRAGRLLFYSNSRITLENLEISFGGG